MGSSRPSTRLDAGVKYGGRALRSKWLQHVAAAGDQRVELVGAAATTTRPEPRAQRPLVAVLAAPRPQPAGEVVERVLAGHAHRAVGLVGVPGRVGRGLVGEELGRGDLEPRRARRRRPAPRPPAPPRRHRTPARRGRGAPARPGTCATGLPNWRRAAVYSSVISSRRFERARHRRGAGERAASTQRVERRRRAPPARSSRRDAVEDDRVARLAGEVHAPARCCTSAGSTCTTIGPSSVVEQRDDLVDGPRPRARGARCRGAAPSRSTSVVAPRAGHDGHRVRRGPRGRRRRGATRRARRSRPAGAAPRGARRSAGPRWRRPTCRPDPPAASGTDTHGQPGVGDRLPDRRAPSRRPRPARPRRTCRVGEHAGGRLGQQRIDGGRSRSQTPSPRPSAGSRSCRRGW